MSEGCDMPDSQKKKRPSNASEGEGSNGPGMVLKAARLELHDELIEYAITRIETMKQDNTPFTHLVVDGLVPPAFYGQLCASFPDQDLHNDQWHADQLVAGKSTRFVFHLDKHSDYIKMSEEQVQIWTVFYKIISSPKVIKCICKKLSAEYTEELMDSHTNMQLIRDTTGFAITPHCDTPTVLPKGIYHDKLLTTLFYCPGSNSDIDLGTELYSPDENGDLDVSVGAYTKLPDYPKRFKTFKKVPFVGNTLVAFVPMYGSTWHGVSQIKATNPDRRAVQSFARPRKSNTLDYEISHFH